MMESSFSLLLHRAFSLPVPLIVADASPFFIAMETRRQPRSEN